MKKTPKPQPSEKKPTDEAMTTLLLDRQERVQRCGELIKQACEKERVTLHVPGFDIVNGQLIGKIQLVAMD